MLASSLPQRVFEVTKEGMTQASHGANDEQSLSKEKEVTHHFEVLVS